MPRRPHQLAPVVKRMIANNPRWSADRIRLQLEEEAPLLIRGHFISSLADLPSESTIGRIKHEGVSEGEQRALREVHWPDRFLDLALPWDAAPLALELLRRLHGRPLVLNVLWAWRITQAHPNLRLEERWRAACFMSAWELAPDANEDIPASVEAWLIDPERSDSISKRPGLAVKAEPRDWPDWDMRLMEALLGMTLSWDESEGEENETQG